MPLIACPFCGRTQVELIVSARPETEGKRFYKCPYYTGRPGGCGFFKSEKVYLRAFLNRSTDAGSMGRGTGQAVAVTSQADNQREVEAA